MENERDLLPWILGGVLLTTLAAATTAVLNVNSGDALPPSRRATELNPVAVSAPPPPVPVAPVPAPAPAASVVAVATQPAKHIWECDVNGHQIFADSPCGDHAAIRELHAINGMRPSPTANVLYPSAPMYASIADPDQPDAETLDAQGSHVYVINGVSRRDHAARHHPHERGPRGVRR